ncbi:TRAP transporter small permease [Jiella mangrovi]|uniref:TRAP transporter small permease protein n=1 Tax=Jiella mangrovi TaxID=2821407 RepID=A0ABS4BL25_9HYPH|nr:TRAP transporter small permease subunit [Jiella mangrovi]MBP0617411.1 TRAP transporter small permease subunit [Jiella mangrovi]
MHKVLDFVDRVMTGVVVIALAIIVVVVAIDVVGRYGFGHSLIFANELSRLAFLWMSFLVMPLGISRGMHVSITSVIDGVPAVFRGLLVRAGCLATIVLMGVVFAGAWISIERRSVEMLNTLPISAAWFFYPLAFGSAWSIVHLLVLLVEGGSRQRAVSETTAGMPS